MGVYVNGMEMPKNCGGCPLRASCVHRIYMEERPPDCPLVPVPPHGRLIDADALIADLKRQCREVFRVDAVSPDDFWITRIKAYNERLWGTWCESFFDYLQTRPIIIPASEEET